MEYRVNMLISYIKRTISITEPIAMYSFTCRLAAMPMIFVYYCDSHSMFFVASQFNGVAVSRREQNLCHHRQPLWLLDIEMRW